MNIFFKINNNKLYKLLKSLYNLFKAKFSQPLIGIILPVIILLIWYFLAVTETIRNSLLPTPNEVLKEILILANEGTLFSHIQITLTRVFYGFIGGGIAATILGILTGVSPFIRKFFDPTIQALKAVPSLAWVPLFILWFGIFENSKVALISVGVFFPVYLNLMMDYRTKKWPCTRMDVCYSCRTYGSKRRTWISYDRWPNDWSASFNNWSINTICHYWQAN